MRALMSAGTKEGHIQGQQIQPLFFSKFIGFKRALPSQGGLVALNHPPNGLFRAGTTHLTKAQEHLLTANCWPHPVQPKPLTYPILLISFQGPM